MTNFALITEGITDQIVIENILKGYFHKDDMEFKELQPSKDNTDTNYGNWLNVFEYCGSSKFRGAFQYNEYIIIQIDTDVSEEKHYDVPRYENGVELTPEELIKNVISKFKEIIGTEVYKKY